MLLIETGSISLYSARSINARRPYLPFVDIFKVSPSFLIPTKLLGFILFVEYHSQNVLSRCSLEYIEKSIYPGDSMSKKHPLIIGTFVLTATGFVTRLIGFFFRLFLSNTFTAEEVGLYQLIFPVYALCISLTAAGVETALSRCIAHKVALRKEKEADYLFYFALLSSLSLSLIVSIFLQTHVIPISIYILGDLRCQDLLFALSFVLPFSSIHCCVCGYCFGKKQTTLPAISQFIEQLVRVGSVFLLYQFHSSILIAVIGLAIGEFASSFFCLYCFFYAEHARFRIQEFLHSKPLFRELYTLSLPLTSTRVLTNLLQSVETISIPLSLQKFGYTNAESLSTYGILTGMALPCILFPSALTNSISTMLLPTVAEIQTTQNKQQLLSLIRKIFLFGLFFGCSCGIFFLLFSSQLGMILFQNELAGTYLQTLAWICPFLYLNSTLISVLNGLGKAGYTFFMNITSISIRICGVLFAIPSMGMQGYLHGLLYSQLAIFLLAFIPLYTYKTK